MNHVIIINPYTRIDEAEYNKNEILSLSEATDCEVIEVVDCRILKINPATYIGKGKVGYIRERVEKTGADMVIFNGELSPSQTLNISDEAGVAVITKTNLILDIFARRAMSYEGKILVELAQLKYIYPRLKGKGDSLSRQGGGIGTVGPGETKLETDRRYIKGRIRSLEKNLAEIRKRQSLQKSRREKNDVKTVAIVGYTNAGKSTLMNILSGSNVLEMDMVFATLDPTARMVDICGEKVIFIDTVGFIKDLPESLVEAFKSTLEVAKTSDLLLCLSDITTDFSKQTEVTNNILNEIGASKNRLFVLNKCDCGENQFIPREYIKISAKDGVGIENLKKEVYSNLFGKLIEFTVSFPYEKSYLIDRIKKLSSEISIIYRDSRIEIKGKTNKVNYQTIQSYTE